jgi:hypothetical protein
MSRLLDIFKPKVFNEEREISHLNSLMKNKIMGNINVKVEAKRWMNIHNPISMKFFYRRGKSKPICNTNIIFKCLFRLCDLQRRGSCKNMSYQNFRVMTKQCYV